MFFRSILLLSILKSAICEKELVNIVGIFEYGEEESFRNAMGKVNSDKDLNLKFNLIPVKLYPDDAFGTLNSTCHILQQGTVGIFGPSSTSNVNMVTSICNATKIPHILTRNVESKESGMQINIFPHSHLLIGAYLDIIKDLEWTDVTVLYIDQESLPNLGYLIEKGSSYDLVVKIVQLVPDDDKPNRLILTKLRESEQRHFMIYCHVADLEYILLQLQQNGMLTEGFNYFLTDLEAITIPLRTFSYGNANIIGVELSTTETSLGGKKLLPNLEANLIYDAMYLLSTVLTSLNITKFVSLDCYAKNNRWKYGEKIINSLISISNYSGLTGPISFDSSGHRKEFELRIFEIQDGELKYSGSWNTSNGLNMLSEAEYDTTRNIIVITTLTEPYAMLKPTVTPLYGNDRYEGFVIDLIEELSQKCNFEYTFKVREDMRVGVVDPGTNTWSGMIGDVIDEEADLAIGDVTITAEREDAVDFTIPFMSTGISILYRKPLMSGRFRSVIDALPLNSWISTLVACFLVPIVFLFLGRISAQEWVNPSRCKGETGYVENELTFINSLFFVIGSATRQSYDIKLRSVATRIVAAVWWLFILVVVMVYIGNLVAILSNPMEYQEENDFSDLHELVERAPALGIKYGAKMGGATAHFFMNRAVYNSDDVYLKAWQSMEANAEDVMVRSNADGVEKVINERYAFFMESTSIEYAVARRCELQQIGSLLDMKGYGIAMRKNESLRNCLNVGILQMSQAAKLAELKRKWWEEKRHSDNCNGNEEDEVSFVPLNEENFRDVFHITLIGTLIALLLAIIEAVLNTVSNAKKAKIPLCKALRNDISFILSFNKSVKPLVNKQYSSMSPQGGATGPYSEEKELKVMS